MRWRACTLLPAVVAILGCSGGGSGGGGSGGGAGGNGAGRIGASGSAPSATASAAPDAVVLIVIDTLRGDRLGCTGFPTARTPHLDALARRGALFEDAMTPAPVTLPSVCSLLTGRLPFHHGVRDNQGFPLPADETTLAERFTAAGWRTAAVVASAVLEAATGIDQGFESFDDHFEGPYPVYDPSLQPFAEELSTTRRRADVVTDLALARLRGFGDDRFFLFLHYFDVHAWYDPPPRDRALHRSPYDGEITFVDREIGRLLEGLASRPRALVVVVSDHGEGLGEHGEAQHGFLLYQSTLHVLFLAAGPGVPRGVRRADPVSLVDLAPTLAKAAGLPDGEAQSDGRILGWTTAPAREAPLYAETFHTLVSYGWRELRALRRGHLKLIDGPPAELYDLAADPHETRDLAADPRQTDAPAAHPHRTRNPARGAGSGGAADVAGGDVRAVVADLRAALAGAVDGDDAEVVLARARGGVDEQRQRTLHSLGYVAGAAPSMTTPQRERPHPRDALPRWAKLQERKKRRRLGIADVKARRSEQGVARLDSVLAEDPHDLDALYFRALARDRLGDRAGSRRDLDRAVAVDSTFAPAQLVLARRDERSGHVAAARARLRAILTGHPDHRGALRTLSNSHMRKEDVAGALPYLRRLVALDPEDPDAQYNLGVATWQLGLEAEAREHLQAVLRLQPTHPRAADIRGLLAEDIR